MWIGDIESSVFTRVKADGNNAFLGKYPDILFTTDNESDAEPSFPSVYIQELAGTETGQGLEGSDINGILCSFQVDVKDNDTTKLRTKEVMNNVVKTMKNMRFQIISSPTYRKENGVWLGTARFRRLIGFNDKL